MHGATGEDLVLKVPVGTVVLRSTSREEEVGEMIAVSGPTFESVTVAHWQHGRPRQHPLRHPSTASRAGLRQLGEPAESAGSSWK